MKSIDLREAFLAMETLPKMLPTPEPIGPVDARALRKLNAAITQPFVSYGGHYPYRYIYHRAAALFYFVIKDHAFENGNKRCAVVVTMLFLVKNKKMLNFYPDELYEMALEVAISDASMKDAEIERLKRIFKNAIADLPENEIS